MGKPKILLLGKINYAREAWESLCENAEVIIPNSSNRAGFLEECRAGRFDGVLVAYRTSPSVSVTGLIDRALIDALPTSLRAICHNGAGYDQIDVAACTNRRIEVSNVTDPVAGATADTALFLIIGALRGFNKAMASARSGAWLGDCAPGRDSQDAVLGIVGLGTIGKAVARRAKSFGMQVQYFNRNRATDEQGCKYVTFEELLRTSDVISLNLPLNKNTAHFISRSEFEQMKPGVVLINTARGAIVDEAVLVEMLKNGKVGAAGLDVFENEPKIHAGLLSSPRAMLLPHVGTYTVQTLKQMEEWTIDNVRMAVHTGRLKSRVVEQESVL